MELELAKEDLGSFALQKNWTLGRHHFPHLVDENSVHDDSNSISSADAFEACPLGSETLDVARAAKVEEIFPARSLAEPVDTASEKHGSAAAFLPVRPVLGITLCRGLDGESGRDTPPVSELSRDEQQVTHATLHDLAFDCRFVGALAVEAVAVGSGAVEKNT